MFFKGFSLDLLPSEKRTILICGVGRSGTTWLGAVIARSISARQIFEPFIIDENLDFMLASSNRIELQERIEYPLFITENLKPRYLNQFKKILFGFYSNGWVKEGSEAGFFYKRVIKDIRLNLNLKFITSYFPSLRIIYIVRSYHSVISSMLIKERAGWRFSWNLEDIFTQKELLARLPQEFVSLLNSVQTIEEKLMVRWCVENIIAVEDSFTSQNILLVKYENLLSKEAWVDIKKFIRPIKWQDSLFDADFDKPSRTSDINVKQKKEVELNQTGLVRQLYISSGLSRCYPDIFNY